MHYSYFCLTPIIRCSANPPQISLNNSRNSNHRHISLTGTDHCRSKFSKDIQFEKKSQSIFFDISQNIKENKLQKKNYTTGIF